MELDNDPVQGSILRVLKAACAAVTQQPTGSLYRALSEAGPHMAAAAAGISHDPETYTQKMHQYTQGTHQLLPEGVMVQGRVSRTAKWMEVAEKQHAQDSQDKIQHLDARHH